MGAYLGIDLHRRRSLAVCVNEAGDRLWWRRFENSPENLAGIIEEAGPEPEVAIEATWGWYWAAEMITDMGGQVHLVMGKEGIIPTLVELRPDPPTHHGLICPPPRGASAPRPPSGEKTCRDVFRPGLDIGLARAWSVLSRRWMYPICEFLRSEFGARMVRETRQIE